MTCITKLVSPVDPRVRKTVVPVSILVAVLVFGLTAVRTFSSKERYSSAAQIRLQFGAARSGGTNVSSEFPYSLFLETECQVIQSEVVLRKALESLRKDRKEAWVSENLPKLQGRMDVRPGKDKPLISIRVFGGEPDEPARLANAIAEAYRDRQSEYLERVPSAENGILVEITARAPAGVAQPQERVLELLWGALGSILLALSAGIIAASRTLSTRCGPDGLPNHFCATSLAVLSFLLGIIVLFNPANLPAGTAVAILVTLAVGTFSYWVTQLRRRYPAVRRVFPVGVLAVFACVLGPSLIQELLGPNSYSATALVRLGLNRTNAAADELPQGAFGMYNPSFLRTECELLQCDPIVLSVIRDLDLSRIWAKRFFGPRIPPTKSSASLLRELLHISPLEHTSIIKVQVISDQKSEALIIANALARAYRDYHRARESAGYRLSSPRVELLHRALEAKRLPRGHGIFGYACYVWWAVLWAGMAGIGVVCAASLGANRRNMRGLLEAILMTGIILAFLWGVVSLFDSGIHRCSPALIRVSEKGSSSTMPAAAGPSAPDLIQAECDLIRSDSILREVASRLQLAKGAATGNAWELHPPASYTADALRARLEMRRARGMGLLEIILKGNDTREAAMIANVVAETYCEYRGGHPRLLSPPQTTTQAEILREAGGAPGVPIHTLASALANALCWLFAFAVGVIPCCFAFWIAAGKSTNQPANSV